MRLTTAKIFPVLAGAAMCLGLTQCGMFGGDDIKVEYMAVQESEGDDWSFLAPNGELVCAEEFENQPTAVVNGLFSVKEGKDGYTLYEFGDKPKKVKGCDELLQVGAFNDGIIPVVKKNSRIMLVNKSGEQVAELKAVGGHEIVYCDFISRDGLLGVTTDEGKCGYVDTKGEIAIKPKYAKASYFENGMAVVWTDEKKAEVIDKKGETVFKFKKGTEDVSRCGDFFVYKDKRVHVLDAKGEEVWKCPEKIRMIYDIQGKYAVCVGNDGTGVYTLDGEEVLRCKYDAVHILPGARFLCEKKDNKGLVIMDKNGDEKETLDEPSGWYVEGFGVVAGQYGGEWTLYSDKLEKKGKKSFCNIGLGISQNYQIESDYFDADGMANTLADIVAGSQFQGISIGQPCSAVKILADKGIDNLPSYSSSYSWEIQDNDTWRVKGKLEFTANYKYNDWGWDDNYNYYDRYLFNPDSYLAVYGLEATLFKKGSHAPELAVALGKALKSKLGLTEELSTDIGAIYTKGDAVYCVYAEGNSAGLIVMAKGDGVVENLKNALIEAEKAYKRDSDSSSNYDYDYGDSVQFIQDAYEVVEEVADSAVEW